MLNPLAVHIRVVPGLVIKAFHFNAKWMPGQNNLETPSSVCVAVPPIPALEVSPCDVYTRSYGLPRLRINCGYFKLGAASESNDNSSCRPAGADVNSGKSRLPAREDKNAVVYITRLGIDREKPIGAGQHSLDDKIAIRIGLCPA